MLVYLLTSTYLLLILQSCLTQLLESLNLWDFLHEQPYHLCIGIVLFLNFQYVYSSVSHFMNWLSVRCWIVVSGAFLDLFRLTFGKKHLAFRTSLWLRWQSICLQCKRTRFDPWVTKILWRRKLQPTPVHLPAKSHGWRSLLDYSSWGHKEWDTTEWLHFEEQLGDFVDTFQFKEALFHSQFTEFLPRMDI